MNPSFVLGDAILIDNSSPKDYINALENLLDDNYKDKEKLNDDLKLIYDNYQKIIIEIYAGKLDSKIYYILHSDTKGLKLPFELILATSKYKALVCLGNNIFSFGLY